MFDDSNLPVEQRLKNVGLCAIVLPIFTSGYITEKCLLVGGFCVSPVAGTIEYIGTGKCDKTMNTLNAIGNINRMVINNFLEEKDQLMYRKIF